MTPKKKSEPKQQEQPKPAAQPQPPTTTTTPKAQTQKPEPVSKQKQTVAKLIDAWKARGVDVSKLEQVADGKFLLLRLPNFPTIKIGPSGGGDLPEIGSYAKFFDAAVIGDQLLAKKTARDAKKQTAAAPAKPAAQPPAQAGKAKDTPTARKQKADAALEAQLA